MKISAIMAALLVLAASPALARPVHKPHGLKAAKHTERTSDRTARRRGLSLVTVGSTVTITRSGEVVVPQSTIAVVHDLSPKRRPDRLSTLPAPSKGAASPL